jgi:hypothetical protein
LSEWSLNVIKAKPLGTYITLALCKYIHNEGKRPAVQILAVRHLKARKPFSLARSYLGGFLSRRRLWLRCFLVLLSAYSLELRIILIVSGCLFVDWLLLRIVAAQESRVCLQEEPLVLLASLPPPYRLRCSKEAKPPKNHRGRRCVRNRS